MKQRKKKVKQQMQMMEKASLRHAAEHKARRDKWIKHEYHTEPATPIQS